MGFKNYLLFRVKTYGIAFLGLIFAVGGFGFMMVGDSITGLIAVVVGGVGILYARYEWREHDIRQEQRKLGRR